MKHFLLLVAILLPMLLRGQTETEPNNTLPTANLIQEGALVTGSISSTAIPADVNDYFVSLPNDDGTLKVFFSFSGGLADADMFAYVYNKAGTQIGSKVLANIAAGSDSITVHCRERDTMYIRFNCTGNYNYQFSYQIASSGTNDVGQNDGFAGAIAFAQSDLVHGRIGYMSISADVNDYYFSVLPEDGTLRYYVQYENTSGSTGADFYSFIYNKNQTQIASGAQANQPLGLSHDTITVYGRAADTVFFRITASDCFSYTFRYEVLPAGPPDPEPNNTFADAVAVTANTPRTGRIGYTSVAADANDYFYTILPDDGTLRYYVQYDNTSGSTGADFLSFIYNKNQAQIGIGAQANQPLGLSADTITVYGLAADTVFFRINASGSFSYSFQYEVLPAGPSDPEPNNTFADAVAVTANTPRTGRIGYTSVASDANDYFYSVLPDDGTLRYYVQYDNTSGSAGADFYTFIYNKNQAQIGIGAQANQPLGLSADTITVYGRAADTVFFRINASGSFNYSFRYEVLPA